MKVSSYFRSRVADANSDECASGNAAMNNDIEMRIIIGWVVLLFGILVIYLFFWKRRRK